MAIGATKPATPEARAGGNGEQELESANTVPPPAPNESADARIPPDTMVADRYRIARVLGEGGMGVVYAAEHVLMRKEVALKVLHADMCSMPEVVARFEREAIAAAHIDHPNIAGATDFGRLPDGSCYLVLELLRGTSLRDEITKGPIPLGRSLRILRGIAAGVSAAHLKGVVHRDLKPENVMLVDRDGAPDFVKVLDFGIAKLDATVGSSPQSQGKILTRIGAVFGTPEYMAPEQAVGDTVDARADLYALGVIFLEMLTGQCPFTGNALSILRERILAVGPPDMTGVADPGARALISKLLTRQPDDRMQTGVELVTAIDALLDERKGGSLPPPALSGELPSPTAQTNPGLVAGADARPRWVIPAAIAALLAVSAGMFALVTALGRPAAHVPVTRSHSATAEPSASVSVSAPTASIELPATDAPPGESAAVETPAPTASAASARATPRPKPAPKRPQPAPKKTGPGGLYVPPPKDWFK